MKRRGNILSFLKTDPALMLGLASSIVYYVIMFQPAMQETVLAHYTTEHAVEYVIVTLFFWGMFDVTLKLLSFPRELLAARHEWLPPRTGREPASKARELLDGVMQNPPWLLASNPGKRIVHALSFVADKGSADDYREHIRHLADLADQELHGKYTVIRFVIAVTPILGFLGTVVHFGGAIGSFSFDDMSSKLPEIVAGMGTAFNTTSVALATAMTMMFLSFLCERVDQSFVASTDRLVDSELLHRFEIKDPNILPFLTVIDQANQESLTRLEQTLQQQVQLWSQSFDTLFERFDKRQLQEAARAEGVLEHLFATHQAYEETHEDRLRQVIAIMDLKQDKSNAQMMAVIERAAAFREDVAELLQSLNAIARGEGRLVELQSSLSNNLRVLHETSQLDSALHGLSAAIHLLTSRNREIGIAESEAA
jgi:biopolymer transport protein ExbB/TolQ